MKPVVRWIGAYRGAAYCLSSLDWELEEGAQRQVAAEAFLTDRSALARDRSVALGLQML